MMTRQGSVFIIAEAGVNHDGDVETALAMIDAAAGAGVDAVKFQSFRADRLASRRARKADYQAAATDPAETQHAMLRRLELSRDGHLRLVERCAARGIAFLSTPFDTESLDLLVRDCGVAHLKIGSGDLTNGPLLLAAARTGLPLFVSTGMGTLGEVEEALAVLAYGLCDAHEPPGRAAFAAAYADNARSGALAERVTLLHCVTEYPAPPGDANLRAMDTLAGSFGVPVGFSDHSTGIALALAAAARGAAVLEKHFTLDRTRPGPDHAASLEPAELTAMVAAIRDIEAALGDGRKTPRPSERRNLAVARKSVVAARPIAAGETLSPENLAIKRPGDGMSPMRFWDLLGRPAPRAYAEEDAIVD